MRGTPGTAHPVTQGCGFLPGRVGGVRSEAFFTYPPTLHNLLAEEGRPYPPTLSPDDVHPTPKPNRKIGAEEIIHSLYKTVYKSKIF